MFVYSTQSQTGSSLGGSLGSTGGSGDTTRRTADPLGSSHLRNVELGNIGISNQFEEEDSQEETKSESVCRSVLEIFSLYCSYLSSIGYWRRFQ